jgi:nucleoid-associated protein YgaU
MPKQRGLDALAIRRMIDAKQSKTGQRPDVNKRLLPLPKNSAPSISAKKPPPKRPVQHHAAERQKAISVFLRAGHLTDDPLTAAVAAAEARKAKAGTAQAAKAGAAINPPMCHQGNDDDDDDDDVPTIPRHGTTAMTALDPMKMLSLLQQGF